MSSHITDCGIPGIGKIPWGGHFCQFYRKREELVGSLVPFFAAGLRQGERCLWVTADPFRQEDALAELRKAWPDTDRHLESGALRVLDFDRWYVEGSRAKGEDVVAQWIREEEAALAAGFSGLRITGNTSFLTEEMWADFMTYEAAVTRAFASRRIVALCSYDIRRCQASHVFDVVRGHPFTLGPRDNGWEVIETTHVPF